MGLIYEHVEEVILHSVYASVQSDQACIDGAELP